MDYHYVFYLYAGYETNISRKAVMQIISYRKWMYVWSEESS